MKVVFLPRDANPYQAALARELERHDVSVSFVDEVTPSQSLNLLLLPWQLAVARLRGHRVLHVHWVYGFGMPWTRRVPVIRHLSRAWFGFVLLVARGLGLRIVWTAHNLLPHSPVFPDDREGRRVLLRRSSAVLAHSPRALADLEQQGWPLPVIREVVRHGPVETVELAGDPASQRARLGIPLDARVVGFVGNVETYKGVDDLAAAAETVLQGAEDGWVLVVGRCRDQALEARMRQVAARCSRLVLDLRFVPDDELGAVLRAIDVVVLPFRRITTSGSAVAALGAARPVLLPREAPLEDLPSGALERYDDLRAGLTWALSASGGDLAARSAVAEAWTREWSWSDVAAATAGVYRRVLLQTRGAAA